MNDPYGPIAFGEADMPTLAEPDKPKQDKHAKRKATPVYSGALAYFPDAMCEVSRCSLAGSEQHHPGAPLHWDKSKSSDEPDALVRHLLQYDQMDDDGVLHAAKVAWRGLALLQRTLEARGEAPINDSRND